MRTKITPTETDQRLDIWLATKFHTKSRHFLQKEIKAGRVLVNHKTKKPSYKLKAGDEIKIKLKEPQPFKLKPNGLVQFEILQTTKDFIAINKPPGLAVHPGAPPRNDTLVSGLLAKFPEIKDVGDAPNIRPGIVHRLDKDTSGVMLVARHQASFEWLKQQFAQRKVQKIYLALVAGRPKKSAGTIENFLARSKSNPTKQTVIGRKTNSRLKIKARPAKTKFKIQKSWPSYTLLVCQPQTGRQHQIRVHLRFLGTPIVGDPKYGPRQDKLSKKLRRQFLHAQSISFRSPDGRKYRISAPLSRDLLRLITCLD